MKLRETVVIIPCMGTPVVCIVGRQNVGKSTLFNAIANRRISIEEPTSGVTRDRISTFIERGDIFFELIDTAGMGVEIESPDKSNVYRKPAEELALSIRKQIDIALSKADLILFVVDVQAGLTSLDKDCASLLHKLARPVILVANKADNSKLEESAAEFHALGLGHPLPVAALHRRGISALIDEISKRIPKVPPDRTRPVLELAVVGRRNVGKSTLINTLAGEERVLVSEIPGTTRDSIDVHFELDGRRFTAIDTAGVRKKGRIEHAIEFFSIARAYRSIRRASVVLLVIDATTEISDVDKKLARYIEEQLKPCVIVLNKWDLVKDAGTKEYIRYLNKKLNALPYAPVSFISAKDGTNVIQTVHLALELWEQASRRISTGRLNRLVREVSESHRPRTRGATTPRIYYATQAGVNPPVIVFFVNDPELFPPTYRRYLENKIRQEMGTPNIPIGLVFRQKKSAKAKDAKPKYDRT